MFSGVFTLQMKKMQNKIMDTIVCVLFFNFFLLISEVACQTSEDSKPAHKNKELDKNDSEDTLSCSDESFSDFSECSSDFTDTDTEEEPDSDNNMLKELEELDVGVTKRKKKKSDGVIHAHVNVHREVLGPDFDDHRCKDYWMVMDRVLNYAKAQHKIDFVITSVQKITNSVLEKKMKDHRNSLFEKSKPDLYFHGSTFENIEKIISKGFSAGSEGMFGPGIYFATDSTKSMQYSLAKDRAWGKSYSGSLLLCAVMMGRSLTLRTAVNDMTKAELTKMGYDSVFAERGNRGEGGVRNDEFIVYRSEQACPKYLIQFRTLTPDETDSYAARRPHVKKHWFLC